MMMQMRMSQTRQREAAARASCWRNAKFAARSDAKLAQRERSRRAPFAPRSGAGQAGSTEVPRSLWIRLEQRADGSLVAVNARGVQRQHAAVLVLFAREFIVLLDCGGAEVHLEHHRHALRKHRGGREQRGHA